MRYYGYLLWITVSLTIANVAVSKELSKEELEAWFNSDNFAPPDYKEVNSGELVFLTKLPEKPVHHHHNKMKIVAKSASDGWVHLTQCHTNLDKVGASEIVFNPERVRDLKITVVENIEKAWVEGPSVQMVNISGQARLCLQGMSRALQHNPDGSYTLRNGPFMRKFFDGYFPMRVTVELDFAGSGLGLSGFLPEIQPGFSVQHTAHSIAVDAVFEGRLHTEFHFQLQRIP